MARLKISTIPTTSTPEADHVALYAKPDKRLYLQNADALERALVLDGDVTPGFQTPEYRQLTHAEIAAGKLTLSATPTKADNTLVDVRGGPSLWYGIDFEVNGDKLIWSGMEAEPFLEEGDWLRIIYV